MPIDAPITLLTPLRRNLELVVTQAPGGDFSHDGDLYYGWDFAATSGSLFGEKVLAIADGTVVFVEESVPDGDPASGSFGDDGSVRDPSLGPAGALGNVVTIEHVVDGQVFYASYLHLAQDSIPLEVGDTVSAGQVIGLVGNTGYRTDTHLHLNIGNTLGDYTNGANQDFGGYQIAEGPDDGGGLLALVDFADSSNVGGELSTGDTFTSSTTAVQNIVRISTAADGSEANGGSGGPVFSPDGTMVAFSSHASNLVPGDTNGTVDIFVKTLATGAIERISVAADGSQANDYSAESVFSPDGTKVAFTSDASNLVPDDTNGVRDIFVKTLATGAIERISVAADGSQANEYSLSPVFSPDGTKVAFSSYASTLVPGDTNGTSDLFVKSLVTGAIERISVAVDGSQASGNSVSPVFSPDGTKVAFASNASNLVPDDTNDDWDILVKTLATGAIERISVAANGSQASGSSHEPIFSPDGTKIVFWSYASNLVPDDTNRTYDVFVKTLATGAIERISVAADGSQANNGGLYPIFSPDGTKVAFSSRASNLVPGDTNNDDDTFIKSLATGAIERISADDGITTNYGNYDLAFSPDGTNVAFNSSTGNIVPGDTNGLDDVFIAELGESPPGAIDSVANDIGTTAALAAGATVAGVIDQDDLDGSAIDADYYRVTLTGGHRYTFGANADVSTSDTLDEVFIRLRDADGNLLSPDRFDEGASPSLTFDAPGSGDATYYLAISAGGAGAYEDKTGSYTVSLVDDELVPWSSGYENLRLEAAGLVGDFPGGSEFGWSVALSGNGRYAFVSDDAGAGRIHTFDLASGWQEGPSLQGSDAATDGGNFGLDIAVSDDGGTVIIGDSSGGISDGGAAYVFDRTDDGWLETFKIVSQTGGRLGEIVELTADGNIAFVGDINRFYIFQREGLSWTQLQETDVDYRFDFSISDDGNLLVLPYFEDSDADNQVDLYGLNLYERVSGGNTWEMSDRLIASTNAPIFVGGYVDVSADGSTIFFSIPGDEDGRGSVFIFTKEGDLWIEGALPLPVDTSPGYIDSGFGDSVAISDSGNYALIGRDSTWTDGQRAGAAYIYERDETRSWREVQMLVPEDSGDHDLFGSRVALSGSGDLALVSAPWYDPEHSTSDKIGAADLFWPAINVVIDFGPTFGAPSSEIQLTDQLAGYGVIFSSTSPDGVLWLGDDPTIGSYSYVFNAGWEDTGFGSIAPITIDFVDPDSGLNASVSNFSVRAFDDGGDNDILTVTGYDADGVVVTSETLGPSPFSSPGQTISISGSGIDYAVLETSGTFSGLFFDDVSFTIDGIVPGTIDSVANDIGTTAALAAGATVAGVIDQDDLDGSAIDADYYRVTLSGGHRYTFGANADVSTSDTLDEVFIRLRDADGNLLSPDRFDEGASPSFTFDAPGSGDATYYLAISAGGAGAFEDKTGSYTVSLADNGAPSAALFDFSGQSDASWQDILLAAHFAIDSYNGTGSERVFEDFNLPVGWSILKTTNDGFYIPQNGSGADLSENLLFPTSVPTMQATAYQNADDQVVVAFRGTDDEAGLNLGQLSANFPDEFLYTSFPLGLGVPETGGNPRILSGLDELGVSEVELITTSYLIEAFNFVNELVSSGTSIEDIIFTGHSLGAIVAGYIAAATHQDSMVFAGGPNNLLTDLLGASFFDQYSFARAPEDGEFEIYANSIRINGEFLGEISKLGNDFDAFINFVEYVGGLNFSPEETDAFLDRWLSAFANYNELPDLQAGSLFDISGISGLIFDASDLHKMQLHYVIAYADHANGFEKYKELPGFLSAFFNFFIADSADNAVGGNSYVDNNNWIPGTPSETATQMFSDVVLSRLDTRPDVLTGLLEDAEYEIAQLKYGVAGAGGVPDFGQIDKELLITSVSHFAVEAAARSVLKSADYQPSFVDTLSKAGWMLLDKSALPGSVFGFDELKDVVLLTMGRNPTSVKPFPDEIGKLFDFVDFAALATINGREWNTRGDGNDVAVIAAGDGAVLETGNGNDVLVGTDGNDRLNGWFGDNALLGGEGDDFYRVYVGGGNRMDIVDHGDSDTLSIDGFVTRAIALPADLLPPGGNVLMLEINDGDGFIYIHNHYGVSGKIEKILQGDDNVEWKGIIPELVDDVWHYVVETKDAVVVAVSGAKNQIEGKLEDLKDAVIFGFEDSPFDTVKIADKILSWLSFKTHLGSLVVDIDEDLDGVVDATFTFEGDYVGKDIKLSWTDTDTIITIADQTAPEASDDTYTTDEVTVLAGNVIADATNGSADSDGDGDLLIVYEINGVALADADEDLGQDGVQVTLPSGALLTIADDGSFEYDPNGRFETLSSGDQALDGFDYTISDQRSGSDSATVTITVEGMNDPPTTTGLADVTVLKNAADSVVDLFPAFDDVETADADFAFDVTSSNPALFTSLVVDAQGALTLDFAPHRVGLADVTVTATDEDGASVDAAFHVTVATRIGGDGRDVFVGRRTDDVALGNGGRDVLIGGFGDDSLFGGDDDDRLFGNFGDDLLVGGDGDDRLRGGFGNDTLDGGLGNDTSTGGRGADHFVIGPGQDCITDFRVGLDILDVSQAGIATFAEFQAIASQTNGHVLLDDGGDIMTTLKHVSLGALDADDLLFA